MALACQLSFPKHGHRCFVGWGHPSYKKQFYASIAVEDSDEELCNQMTKEDEEERSRRKTPRHEHKKQKANAYWQENIQG